MSANSINSISEFLLHAGTEYHVFDLGRRIEPTDNQTFLEIENGSAYAPYPRQQHAWFGIVFWNKNASSQHYIWFIKLPLDEQGLVVAAARNHFLEIIVDALGKSIAEDTENAQQLPDNPYSFVPNQSQLAQFNALVKSTLNHPLSEEAQKVEAYIQAPQLVDWQQISMQSVADFIHGFSRHAKRGVLEEAIKANVALYSDVFVNTLMETSESVSLSDNLLAMYLSKIDDGDDINLAALRGTSEGSFNPTINSKLLDLLKNEKTQRIDILSVIAARHFEQMEPLLLSTFLEQAAKVDEKEGHQGALFAGFFSDLVQIPKLRRQVLTLLHSDANSDILSKAFQRLFAQARK
ncbi:DUF3549 family protein [Alteromonas sp. PRIM-21]|uniref:DUF3549 family protein n=1 Tax=Alteromonas sp. PRIM-21 TaxID=1454978 RepID=UPI0022B955E8|nr:DUF3549 family protein [Alteromonas sp. PRIM-21]MCZ8531426.1 DUF3549 family protein [Alteromonas sp. PRIM-21]